MEQYQFKEGDKVKFPLKKTAQSSHEEFKREIGNYQFNYFLVSGMSGVGEVVLMGANNKHFSKNCFNPSDLELYEEEVPIYEIY